MALSYKCTSVGCYSYQSPETNALLQKLQTTINQFAASVVFDPIRVDGIIGKGTTEKALLVLVYLEEMDKGVVGASARALVPAIQGPEQLTANAQAVTDTLVLATKQSALASAATPPAPLPAPTPQPSATQLATTTANAPTSSASAATQQRIDLIKRANPALATSILDRVPPVVAYLGGAALAAGAIAAVVLGKRRASGGAVAGRWRW